MAARVPSSEKRKRILDDSKSFVYTASQYLKQLCSEDPPSKSITQKRYIYLTQPIFADYSLPTVY